MTSLLSQAGSQALGGLNVSSGASNNRKLKTVE